MSGAGNCTTGLRIGDAATSSHSIHAYPTTLQRFRTRRHLLAACLTSIVMMLQPVQSVMIDRVAVLPNTEAVRSGYEVAGHVCFVRRRCGLITVTVRSAEDRFPPAPTR